MRLVETEVLEIEVEQEGPPDGTPLLLLHGWPDAPRAWRPVAARLHERGWRTIAPALRGFGATRFRSPETPRDGRGVALAADAIDLLDALGHDRIPVVGLGRTSRPHAGRGRTGSRHGHCRPGTAISAARCVRDAAL